MGGPMGAYEDALPWMKPEKATIAEAVDAGGATRLAHSPAYEQPVPPRDLLLAGHRVGRRAGLRGGPGRQLGPGAPNLIDQIRAREDEMRTLSRRLFATWLDQVVNLGRDALATGS
jgi:hypothetical protein